MIHGQWFEAYDKLNKEHFYKNILTCENHHTNAQMVRHPEDNSVVWVPRKNSYRKMFTSYRDGDESATRLINHVAERHNFEFGHYETLPNFTKELGGRSNVEYEKLYLFLDNDRISKYKMDNAIKKHKGENYRHSLYNQFALIGDIWIKDHKEDFKFLQTIHLQMLSEIFPGNRTLVDKAKSNKVNNALDHIISRFDKGDNPMGFILKDEFNESVWCKWRQYNDGIEIVSAITRNIEVNKYTILFGFYAVEPKHTEIISKIMKLQKDSKEHTNVFYYNKDHSQDRVSVENIKCGISDIYAHLGLEA